MARKRKVEAGPGLTSMDYCWWQGDEFRWKDNPEELCDSVLGGCEHWRRPLLPYCWFHCMAHQVRRYYLRRWLIADLCSLVHEYVIVPVRRKIVHEGGRGRRIKDWFNYNKRGSADSATW